MPRLIDGEAEKEIKAVLAHMKSPVRLVLFQGSDCESCQPQRELLEELASLSDLLTFEPRDMEEDSEMAARLRVSGVPATLVSGEKDNGIRFYGLTVDQEFAPLLEAILMVSTGISGLDENLEALIRSIQQEVHLQVFVTSTCPFCPRMVRVANQFALVNDHIRSDVVNGAEFPELVRRYKVTAVPRTFINEVQSFEGVLSPASTYLRVIRAIDPDRYAMIERRIRELQGLRKVSPMLPDRLYEIVIVGGGPAAMSAAIYAVRKGLNVGLIADRLGGQMANTAEIDNYLGLPGVSGPDLVTAFRNHMESFPIAEETGRVSTTRREGEVFVTETEDGREFRSSALVLCTGKEYRRLGVEGEERFLGRGISFCAICDAPLYVNRKVAVVGGGNSALTAARDLARFAEEVHIIHRRREFRADEELLEEVLRDPRVKVHTPMVVRSFLGDDKLEGVRFGEAEGDQTYEIRVDGVFLEIGLSPNSSPVKDLVPLNAAGEVVVGRDMSTGIDGLFAAGDVTDTTEKQISVAVGQGAIAALSAHRHLLRVGRTESAVDSRERWES